MTDDELRAIEERANAATDGPWGVWGQHGYFDIVTGSGDAMKPVVFDDARRDENAMYNAEFAAAARTDVPALIAALKAERVTSAEARRERDDAHLEADRLRFAIKHPTEACAAVPVDVWRAWLMEHGWVEGDCRWWFRAEIGPRHTVNDYPDRLSVECAAARVYTAPTTIMADLLARAGWKPAKENQ